MNREYVLEKCREAMKALSGYGDLLLYNQMMGIVADLEDQE